MRNGRSNSLVRGLIAALVGVVFLFVGLAPSAQAADSNNPRPPGQSIVDAQKAVGKSGILSNPDGKSRELPVRKVKGEDGQVYYDHAAVATSPKSGPATEANIAALRSTGGCWSAWVETWRTNVTGDRLWTYRMEVDWCTSWLDRVVSISPPRNIANVYVWAAALGWSFEGVRQSVQWDWYGDKWVYRSWSQSAFHYCPPRVICFQKVYPQLQIDAYGDGTSGFWWDQ